MVLESISEKQVCCNSPILLMNDEYTESNYDEDCSFCEDVEILKNCNDDEAIIINKINPVLIVVLFNYIAPIQITKNNPNIYFRNENNFYNTPQLDSHKTVLLLI